jgi:DNA-binding NarL/FixJ family response regulator
VTAIESVAVVRGPGRRLKLTARETEVLRRVARGLSNAEIAAELYLGTATIKAYASSLFDKLGVRDRVQATVVAYESGLVRSGTND